MTATPDLEAVNRRLSELLPGMRQLCAKCLGVGAYGFKQPLNRGPDTACVECGGYMFENVVVRGKGYVPASLLPPLEPGGPWRVDEGRLRWSLEADRFYAFTYDSLGRAEEERWYVWHRVTGAYAFGPDLATAFIASQE